MDETDTNQDDRRSEGERFYDEEIAPALKAIADKCTERGMSMVAVVEYAPGERGRTRVLRAESGLAMVMLEHCAKMGENLDGYVMGLARYAKEKGINTEGSLVMNYVNSGSP